MATRRKAWIAAIALALGTVAWWGWPYAESAALILDLAGRGGILRTLLPVRERAVTTRDVAVPTRDGEVPARLYLPVGAATRSILVVPGIHAGGVDEPRLVAFSRRLAATGAIVLSLPLPDLRRYAVTPRSTDMLEDAALWMSRSADLAPHGRIALAGISFGGGLALVAAGRPSLAGRVDLVVSLGGQGDLPRVLRYLCTGVRADGASVPPHEYGLAILLLAAVPHFVPADQVAPLRNAVITYLDASSAQSTDQTLAAALFARADAQARALPPPAAAVMRWVTTHDAKTAGPKLLPLIEELAGDPALSPERSPAAQVPVFLLHGAEDNVVPPTEMPALASYLRAHGNTRVETLLTPLISHVDTRLTSIADAWRMVVFWKRVLATPE